MPSWIHFCPVRREIFLAEDFRYSYIPLPQPTRKPKFRQSESGQIVVEYILLLVVAVALAALITSKMVSRNPSNEGFLIQAWDGMIKAIGADTADDVTP
jgi:hypothetical protein